MIYKIFGFIDVAIYTLIDYVYDIFNALVKVNIFNEDDYVSIVNRVYVVLGMVMLFILVYSLLKAIINPDEFAKGEQSFANIIKNTVVSLIIIVILPTVFNLAFNVQNSLLNYGTLPKLIMGSTYDTSLFEKNAGKAMSYSLLSSFFHANPEWCALPSPNGGGFGENYERYSGDINTSACAMKINGNGWLFVTNGDSLGETTQAFLNDEVSLSFILSFTESTDDGKITYYIIVSSIAGAFMLYVLINFCFDMGVRVVKIMFFEIIAPIPVICRILPGGKMKDVFSTWLKKTISTFVDALMRVAIMVLCVFMIMLVIDNFGDINFGSLTLSQSLIARALIIMGIVAFMREAPKLLSEMFHLDSGGMKLGIMDKLKQGGGLLAAGAIGAGVGMLGRNGVRAIKNINAARNGTYQNNAARRRAIAAAAARGLGSTIAGTASGLAHGGFNARNASNWNDVRKASSTAVNDATRRRDNRADYRAQHRSELPGIRGAVQTALNVAVGHAGDRLADVGNYFGIGPDLTEYKKQQEFNQKIIDLDNAADAKAGELIGRDYIAQSAALMREANGTDMSLNAMKEQLELMRNSSFASVSGRTLADFDGNSFTINNERDYSNYLSNLKTQYGKAERDLKKYMKQQGSRGEAGIDEINRVIMAGDFVQASGLSTANTSIMGTLGYSCSLTDGSLDSMVRTANFYESYQFTPADAGMILEDLRGNRVTINNEAEYRSFAETVSEQRDQATAAYNAAINGIISRGAAGIRDANSRFGLSVDENLLSHSNLMGSGERTRLGDIFATREKAENLVATEQQRIQTLHEYVDNPTVVDEIYDGTRRGTDFAYDLIDQLTNNAKESNNRLASEIDRLQREQERRHPNNGNSGS